jgi:hypothetical protein
VRDIPFFETGGIVCRLSIEKTAGNLTWAGPASQFIMYINRGLSCRRFQADGPGERIYAVICPRTGVLYKASAGISSLRMSLTPVASGSSIERLRDERKKNSICR